jgi:hypothetical protein
MALAGPGALVEQPTDRDLLDAAEEPFAQVTEVAAETVASHTADVIPADELDDRHAKHEEARQQFAPWEGGSRGSREHLDGLEWSRSARSLVREAIVDAVEAEGPIQQDRLARMVAAAFDLSRVNAKRVDSILSQTPKELRRGPERDVFWPSRINPETWMEFRGDARAQRAVEHIPLTEIANALATLCQEAGGIERAEALRAALLEFGFVRMTQGVTTRMEQALTLGQKSGRLALERGFVTAPSTG